MVTTPFHVKRARMLAAEWGIEDLRAEADTTLFIDNNRLLDLVPNLPLERAFSVVDQLMAEIIKVVTETITVPSLINLDYADVRTIMSSGVPSFMIVGTGCLDEPPEEIVRSAIKQNPLLDTDYMGAKGCLLHITGGLDLILRDAAALAGALTQELDEKANVIRVARIREDFEGKVRMMAIITGVRSVQVLGPCDEIRDYSVKADEVKAGVTRRIL
jgi:cell division protein FtsZ